MPNDLLVSSRIFKHVLVYHFSINVLSHLFRRYFHTLYGRYTINQCSSQTVFAIKNIIGFPNSINFRIRFFHRFAYLDKLVH